MWYRASHARRLWQTEHTAGGIQEGRKKGGSRGGTVQKVGGWASRDVPWTLVPNISGSMGTDCGPLRKGRVTPSAARRLLHLLLTEGGWGTGGGWFMNDRSKRIKNVVSLQVARERRRQPRGDSNRHVSKGLLERLEAENAQLRDSVAELVLQIQALRDALGRPRSEI